MSQNTEDKSSLGFYTITSKTKSIILKKVSSLDSPDFLLYEPSSRKISNSLILAFAASMMLPSKNGYFFRGFSSL